MIEISAAEMELLESIPQRNVRTGRNYLGFDRLEYRHQVMLRALLGSWGLESRASGHIVDIKTGKMVARGYADLVYRRRQIFTVRPTP